MDIWVDQKYTVTSERKLFVLHRLYSMNILTDDWLSSSQNYIYISFYLFPIKNRSEKAFLFLCFRRKPNPPEENENCQSEMIPVRRRLEARCSSDIQLPSGNETLVFKLGWLFLFCIVFIFAPCLIIPDSVRPSESRFSTAVVAETNLQTGFDSEAKVNLFGSSGLHSQNEKPNPTYIRVGALLQSQSWKPIKPTITLWLCGSVDHSFCSFQPSFGSWGAFNISFYLFDLEYLTIFQRS